MTVELELVGATGVERKQREDDVSFRTRLLRALDRMADEDFFKLSKEAQDWVNEAITAVKAEEDPPPFPDASEEEE